MVEHYSKKSAFANYLQKFQSAEQQHTDNVTAKHLEVKKKSNAAFRHFASKSEEALKDLDPEFPEQNGEKQVVSTKIRQWPQLQGSAELGTSKPIPSLINKTKALHFENNNPATILSSKIRNSSDGSLSSTVLQRRQMFESQSPTFENKSKSRTRISKSVIDHVPPSNLSKSKSMTASNSTVSSDQFGNVSEDVNTVDDDSGRRSADEFLAASLNASEKPRLSSDFSLQSLDDLYDDIVINTAPPSVMGSSEPSVIDDEGDEELLDDIVIRTRPPDAESTSLDISVPPPSIPPRSPRSASSKQLSVFLASDPNFYPTASPLSTADTASTACFSDRFSLTPAPDVLPRSKSNDQRKRDKHHLDVSLAATQRSKSPMGSTSSIDGSFDTSRTGSPITYDADQPPPIPSRASPRPPAKSVKQATSSRVDVSPSTVVPPPPRPPSRSTSGTAKLPLSRFVPQSPDGQEQQQAPPLPAILDMLVPVVKSADQPMLIMPGPGYLRMSGLSGGSSRTLSTVDDSYMAPAAFDEWQKQRQMDGSNVTGDVSVVLSDYTETSMDSGERFASNFSESLLSCGGDQLYQKYHSDAVITDLMDDDDYVLPDNERLYDDITHQSPAVFLPPAMGADGDDAPSAASLSKRKSVLALFVEKSHGIRTLWSKMPEVMKSGVVLTMTTKEIRLQECIFEILSSEVSYQNSLVLLCSHFMASLLVNCQGANVLEKMDHHHLFSNIDKVRTVSERFLQLLEAEWCRSPILNPGTIAQVVKTYAEQHFDVYERYCSNEVYQQRVLTRLRSTNAEFRDQLDLLENDAKCQKLDLQSFLALPMQRVTRLPLLMDAVYKNLPVDDPSYQAVEQCLYTLHKLTRSCNECKRKMENIEEVAQLRNMLDFSKVKLVPVGAQKLVRKGPLVRVHSGSSTLKKMLAKHKQVYFFLLSDLLIIAKRRSEKSYEVIDHVPRKLTDVKKFEVADCPKELRQLQQKIPFLFLLALLNDGGKATEYLLLCNTESDRERWVQAFTPVAVRDDVIYYESWDRPQVQATCRYLASQPDELSLEEGDVITVIKKHKDGVYEGQRIRDGSRGWFPAAMTKEIIGDHAKARNLRMLFRYQKIMLNDDANPLLPM